MEDETLALDGFPVAAQDEAAAAAAAAEQQQEEGEIEKLRSERFHLRSDLDAAVAQADMLRAAVEELRGTKVSLGAKVEDLEGKISAMEAEKEEEAARVAAERRMLEVVAARAAELEGDVSRLQHDLVTAMSGGEEAASEAKLLKDTVEKLQGVAIQSEARITEAEKSGDELKISIERLKGEKDALEMEKVKAEAKILVFEGKVKSFQNETERVSSERESELHRMKVAISELEEKAGFYELKLLKLRELENGDEDDDADGAVHTLAKGPEASHTNFPWKILVGSTATIAGVTVVTFFVHYARKRWGFCAMGMF
ncbi:unnamed protein product [Spirodela intermedia]|uniref:Uncharacterized protein n=1 Tax=Spirodela intermedia TaxID=51605 RepID=A0A7I8KW96_SPIIN|nr:unnamed protein product [Spirodela intermedia]